MIVRQEITAAHLVSVFLEAVLHLVQYVAQMMIADLDYLVLMVNVVHRQRLKLLNYALRFLCQPNFE